MFISRGNTSLFDNLYMEMIIYYLLISIDFTEFQKICSSNFKKYVVFFTKSLSIRSRWLLIVGQNKIFDGWLGF